ncbi:hypothetical protein VHEMI04312 [[Torrubiella] hemipterigena]|uniref:Uncharacterized protein n=1 Tax=[Torrubiella] hemipterigena TaxID=1531966 RepID=A0A0A1SUY1_9HYPO|nr:hypothetical protein VHEMI04312 [[Torrubiella] hemipterigena]
MFESCWGGAARLQRDVISYRSTYSLLYFGYRHQFADFPESLLTLFTLPPFNRIFLCPFQSAMSDKLLKPIPFSMSHTKGKVTFTYEGEDKAMALEIAKRHKIRLLESFCDTEVSRTGATITVDVEKKTRITIARLDGIYFVTTSTKNAMNKMEYAFPFAILPPEFIDYDKKPNLIGPISCTMSSSISCIDLDKAFEEQGAAVSQTVDRTGLFNRELSGLKSIPSF